MRVQLYFITSNCKCRDCYLTLGNGVMYPSFNIDATKQGRVTFGKGKNRIADRITDLFAGSGKPKVLTLVTETDTDLVV
jgi:hypothetical protein